MEDPLEPFGKESEFISDALLTQLGRGDAAHRGEERPPDSDTPGFGDVQVMLRRLGQQAQAYERRGVLFPAVEADHGDQRPRPCSH